VTLGELKAQFKALLNNTIVTNNPALVSTFVNQGIQRIQHELRVPFMEKQILYTIPDSYTKLGIPSDLLQLISIQVDRDGDGVLEYELQRVDMNRVMGASQDVGPPSIYARQGAAWHLGPRPCVGDKVLITYYCEFPALVADTDSNTMSKVAWDAVVYAALVAASSYLNDDRKASFEQDFQRIMVTLQDQADSDELTADAAVRPALYFDRGDEW
jgi:hypothetical protein